MVKNYAISWLFIGHQVSHKTSFKNFVKVFSSVLTLLLQKFLFSQFWSAVLMLNQVMVHQWWGHLRMYPSSIVVLVYINKFTNQPDTLKRILLHWLDNYFLALISDGVRTAVFATFILSLPNSICKTQIKYVLSTTIWALRLAVVRSKYWWDMESNEKFYIRKAFH